MINRHAGGINNIKIYSIKANKIQFNFTFKSTIKRAQPSCKLKAY